MKDWKIIIIGLIVLFVFVCKGEALNDGEEMTVFKKVSVRYNGFDMGTNNGKYQCVELIKRFYGKTMGVNLQKYIGYARNYYVKYNDPAYAYLIKSGFVRYANGGNVAPQIGDIMIYDDATHSIGHVGLMSGGCVDTVEQNWSPDGKFPLTMTISGGNYTISSRSSYPILGWLHMPVGEFANNEYLRNSNFIAKGWHFDSDIESIGQSDHYNLNSRPFTECYQANGGNDVLGASTNKVHQFPANQNPYPYYSPYYNMRKAWVQDFVKNGNYFILVVNEYVLNLDQGYMGVAYPIGGQHRLYWLNHYWELGYAVTNEYFSSEYNHQSTNRYIIQWFERLDEEYYVVIYDTVTKNIWHENGNTTTVPKENFVQHRELNSHIIVPEGVGGGGEDPPPVTADYELYETRFCNTVFPESPYAPSEKKEVFTNGDFSVYYWIDLHNVRKALDINWKWYAPNGSFIDETSQQSSDPLYSGYLYWDWYRAWSYRNINTSEQYGQWRIDLYIDGIKMKTEYFILTTVVPVPENFQINIINNQPALSWEASSGAEIYYIYRNNEKIGETSDLNYTDNTIQPGIEYSYQIRAAYSGYFSVYSIAIKVLVPVNEPPQDQQIDSCYISAPEEAHIE